jgi:hypothetical protein
MSQLQNPSSDGVRTLSLNSDTRPTTPTGSCACCGGGRWWTSYRELFLSVETLASLLGLGLLATGWTVAALGGSACRWLYLAAAMVAGFPIFRG